VHERQIFGKMGASIILTNVDYSPNSLRKYKKLTETNIFVILVLLISFVVAKKPNNFVSLPTCCCEFIAHFGDGLAVTAAAIVHAFADKLDLPDAMGQQEAFAREQAHFRHHLRENCSTPASALYIVVTIAVVARPTGIAVAAAIIVAGIVIVAVAVAAVFSAPFAGDAKPVELDDWPVLPVPHHGGLNHFPEREGKSFSALLGSGSACFWASRIHWIRMFLGLPDPDPLVKRNGSGSGSGPFPFVIKVLSGLK
jgi:hypothetical protein